MTGCTQHPGQEVVGYCIVCGELGCNHCLHDLNGRLYCRRDVQPILRRMEDELGRDGQDGKYPPIAVRPRDGDPLRGYCLHLNTQSRGFHLEEVDARERLTGEARYLLFHELRAIYFVKHFDERKDDSSQWPMWKHCGQPLVVRFWDGELLQGFAHKPYRRGESRFLLVPADTCSNNRGILVEVGAVEGVYSPEEYEGVVRNELRTWLVNRSHDGISKDEATGDFFFERHDYVRAREYYRRIQHLAPASRQIRKKLMRAEYNVGARHIRRHEYAEALVCLERVLELSPHNAKAKEKILRIRRKLEDPGDRAAQDGGHTA
jgi:tetratricopeptide (TPR) repeat protein